MENINNTFDINLSLDTKEERIRAYECIDMYDSEKEFDNNCWGDEPGSTFKDLEGSTAAQIDSKYVFFAAINY